MGPQPGQSRGGGEPPSPCCPHSSSCTPGSHWPSWHPGHAAGSWSPCRPPGLGTDRPCSAVLKIHSGTSGQETFPAFRQRPPALLPHQHRTLLPAPHPAPGRGDAERSPRAAGPALTCRKPGSLSRTSRGACRLLASGQNTSGQFSSPKGERQGVGRGTGERCPLGSTWERGRRQSGRRRRGADPPEPLRTQGDVGARPTPRRGASHQGRAPGPCHPPPPARRPASAEIHL